VYTVDGKDLLVVRRPARLETGEVGHRLRCMESPCMFAFGCKRLSPGRQRMSPCRERTVQRSHPTCWPPPQSAKPLQKFKRKTVYFVKSHPIKLDNENINKEVRVFGWRSAWTERRPLPWCGQIKLHLFLRAWRPLC
jgi:hypothetical protein